MNRIFTICFCLLIDVAIFAQNDVTKFLGIPVDGPKSEMIRKLKSKGFVLNNIRNEEVLNGRFNGTDVNIFISSEKGKVARVMVCDENTMNEADIKIRFNRLCQQFKDNGKYISLEDFIIPEGDDISYEMAVKNKRYQALFYQLPEEEDLDKQLSEVAAEVWAKYTSEQLQNLSDETKTKIYNEVINAILERVRNKPVWFMISELYGNYYITMFYDNEYNRAHGEDL